MMKKQHIQFKKKVAKLFLGKTIALFKNIKNLIYIIALESDKIQKFIDFIRKFLIF